MTIIQVMGWLINCITKSSWGIKALVVVVSEQIKSFNDYILYMYDFDVEAKKIDKFLRDNNIKAVRKMDLAVRFNIPHDERSPTYTALQKLGWHVNWSNLELIKSKESPSSV